MGILKRRMNKIVQDVDSMKVDFQDALEEKGIEEPGNSLPAYPEKILEIEQGGGGGETDFMVNRVRYWDIDGTLLKEEVLEDGQASTPPANPANRPDLDLTFVGWSARQKDRGAVFCNLDIIAEYEAGNDLSAAFLVDVPAGETLSLPVTSSEIDIKWTSQDANWTRDSSGSRASHIYANGYKGWVLVKQVNGGTISPVLTGNADYVKVYVVVPGMVTGNSYPELYWPDLEGLYITKKSSGSLPYILMSHYTPLLKWIYSGRADEMKPFQNARMENGEFFIAPYHSYLNSAIPQGHYKTFFALTTGNTSPAGYGFVIESFYCPQAGPGLAFKESGNFVVIGQAVMQPFTPLTSSYKWQCFAPKKLVFSDYNSSLWFFTSYMNIERVVVMSNGAVNNANFIPSCQTAKLHGSNYNIAVSSVNIVVYSTDAEVWKDIFNKLATGGSATLSISKIAYNALPDSVKAIATNKGYTLTGVH